MSTNEFLSRFDEPNDHKIWQNRKINLKTDDIMVIYVGLAKHYSENYRANQSTTCTNTKNLQRPSESDHTGAALDQHQTDGVLSDMHSLDFRAPQSSVLGPLGFILCTSPVGNIIRKHGLNFHVYADDTQMYISFNPRVLGACQNALSKLELCINELSNWMTVNKLKLNHNKAEFFIAGTTQGLTKLPPVELKVGNDMIKPSLSVRNLEIIFDNHMSMTQHINSLISSVNFHLRNIRRIAKYLDQDTSTMSFAA